MAKRNTKDVGAEDMSIDYANGDEKKQRTTQEKKDSPSTLTIPIGTPTNGLGATPTTPDTEPIATTMKKAGKRTPHAPTPKSSATAAPTTREEPTSTISSPAPMAIDPPLTSSGSASSPTNPGATTSSIRPTTPSSSGISKETATINMPLAPSAPPSKHPIDMSGDADMPDPNNSEEHEEDGVEEEAPRRQARTFRRRFAEVVAQSGAEPLPYGSCGYSIECPTGHVADSAFPRFCAIAQECSDTPVSGSVSRVHRISSTIIISMPQEEDNEKLASSGALATLVKSINAKVHPLQAIVTPNKTTAVLYKGKPPAEAVTRAVRESPEASEIWDYSRVAGPFTSQFSTFVAFSTPEAARDFISWSNTTHDGMILGAEPEPGTPIAPYCARMGLCEPMTTEELEDQLTAMDEPYINSIFVVHVPYIYPTNLPARYAFLIWEDRADAAAFIAKYSKTGIRIGDNQCSVSQLRSRATPGQGPALRGPRFGQ